MKGDSFRRRSVERQAQRDIDENAEEVQRCLHIADDALMKLRQNARDGGRILSADARMLYVASALWSRDNGGRVSRDDVLLLGQAAAMMMHDADGNVEDAAHGLALAAGTGVLERVVARLRRERATDVS